MTDSPDRNLKLGDGLPGRSSEENEQNQLQMLDVYIIDVLSHLEALLRHSTSLQRGLRQLRSETPPSQPSNFNAHKEKLQGHCAGLRGEAKLLNQIIDDLSLGVSALTDRPDNAT